MDVVIVNEQDLKSKIKAFKDGGKNKLHVLSDFDGTLTKVYVNGKKIDNYSEYVIYPDSIVPPGDCIVVLFDETNDDKTDIICESWEVNSWNYDNYERNQIKIGKRSW